MKIIKQNVSSEDLLNFIEKNKKNFPFNFEDFVNIQEYSNKLFQKAFIYHIDIDNKIVCLAAVYANDMDTKEAFISLIVCEPEYQRKGFSSSLLAFVENDVKIIGFNKIRLKVFFENSNAIEFYKKNGFDMILTENSFFIFEKQLF